MPRSVLSAVFLALILAACGGDELPDPSSDAYRESVTAFYQGIAAVQAGEDVGGRAGFERVTELVPGEPAAWANLGVLALRRNDFEEAADLLTRAHELAPENAHLEMLLGLLAAAQGDFTGAAARYERSYEIDPSNVKAAYALAQELERQATPDAESRALTLLRSLSEAHPQNVALAIEAARMALKHGEQAALTHPLERLERASREWDEEARQQLAGLRESAAGGDFRHASTRLAFLRNLLLRVPGYRQDLATIQTPVEQPGDFVTSFILLPQPPPASAPADSTLRFTARAAGSRSGAAVAHAGFFFPSGDSEPAIWYLSGDTLFVDSLALPFPGNAGALPAHAQPVAALDFDYDYNTDLILAGPLGVRLLKGDGQGGFADATSAANLPTTLAGRAYTSVWGFDLDLEGDLDLLLAPPTGPPAILRNNGDGTFSMRSAFLEVSGVHDFAWADLDEDADPDAAFVDELGAVHVYLNERGGVFRSAGDRARYGIASVGVADVNADGRFDLLTRSVGGGVSIDGGEVLVDGSAGSGRGIVVADLDNNGAVDVVVPGDGGSVLRLREAGAAAGGLQLHVAERVVDAGDLDGDGRVDLLAVGPEGPVILHNEGTADYRWQVLRPRSAQATGDQRINSFGIGGQVEVRSGLLFQKRAIDAPQLHFGLGTQNGTDVARIVWPNGDVQAEFDLEPDQPLLTQQRLKGSCPWVFTFDGEGMTFVTDFIWRSPLGLAINGQEQAGVVLTADRVKIDGNQLAVRDGIYDVRITAELWETHFFDQISLIAVDHPAGTEVFVDERFSIPAPDLTPHLMQSLQPVEAAFDERGNEVTAVVAALDERYLGTFERGRYQGIASDHFVEVHLGPAVPRSGVIWLVAQGWVRPTDSSVNVAMSQGANPPPRSLQLEAQSADGSWQVVASNLGFPAGKTKAMTIPIGDVLARYPTARLRLRTNLEVYWDAISWAEGLPQERMTLTELQPTVADLRYRGYSEVTVADSASPEIPHYDRFRSASRQWYDLEGFYTRFGDVRVLLAQLDDRYVIMNAGDEMRFEFPALPPPADGMVRDFLLHGDGWVKDGDFNTAFSRTVRPLPLHRDTAYRGPLTRLENDPGFRVRPQDWEEFHTRYVAPDGFATALAPRN